MGNFGKLPTWWVRNDLIKSFQAGKDLGENIAALKCYLLLTTEINFQQQNKQITINSIMSKTSLSKPMVIKGLAKLTSLNMISVCNNYKNTYTVLNGPINGVTSIHWVKVPKKNTQNALKNLTLHRSKNMLAALKIYIYLLSLRNKGPYVQVKHVTIREHTGVQSNQIRLALDLLINHQLIFISNNPNPARTIFRKNMNPDYYAVNYYYFKSENTEDDINTFMPPLKLP